MYTGRMNEHATNTDITAESATLAPGTRVRICGKPIGVTLNRSTGTVVEPDVWEGYYIIRLDVPALYHHADGREERIQTLREASDNLSILPSLAD